MKTVGFHTVEDRDDAFFINENAPFKSVGSRSFLGIGYYFWEDDIDLAHWWGEIHCSNNYVICSGDITCEEALYFDLVGSVKHRKYLKELHNKLKAEIIRFYRKDDIPLGEIIEYLKRINGMGNYKDIFPFKVIRAVDSSKPSANKMFFASHGKGFIDLSPRTIICLLERNKVFLNNVRIVFPEKYVDEL